MTKKRKKTQSSQNCKSKKNTNKSKNKTSSENRKFSDFSYAELIVLSATLSYSIAEELDEEDLTIFLTFLGLLLSELQVLVTQRAIQRRAQADTNEDIDLTGQDINIDLGE